MVTTTRRDDMTWFACEACGLLFDDRADAETHERSCEGDEPDYLQ
ncbi:hypothetical protein [Halorubrum sp. JWXQ-INN 858]|nr:hypothetical protein [Halorubrum sp. JWXQ-INN 858]